MTEVWFILAIIIVLLLAAAPWWVGCVTTGVARAWHREKWRTLHLSDDATPRKKKPIDD